MKERLTGAIILVVLIVLLVPELLSGPSKSAAASQAAATSSEEPPLRSYTINLADDSRTAGTSSGPSSATPQASGPAQPTPIPESASTAPQAEAATGNSSESEQAGTPAAASGAATVDSTSTAPSDDHPQATALQPSAPTPHPPLSDRSSALERQAPGQRYAAATAKPTASERPAPERQTGRAESSAGGWTVQLGVFSIQANAERLAQELKSQGFHTQVSEISGSGRPLWRVRAGPVSERAAAEQLSARLRAAGHAGSVVPK